MHPASFKINARVLTVFLVVGFAMLAGASYFVIGIGQANLRDAWGGHLRQVADGAAAAVDTYVFHRIIDASVLARVPEVRGEASAGSQKPFDRAAALETDRQWQRSGVPATARDVLTNKAAAFLAEVARLNPIYKELLLTDRHGRVVAASRASAGFLLASERWWVEAFGDGVHGQLTVSDVRFEARTNTWGMEITVPVEEPAGGTLAGVLRAVADIREVSAVLGGVRMGATGDASLLREDGSILFGLRPVEPNARFFAADLLRERLAWARKGDPQASLYFSASTSDGTPRLVGVAQSQLKASFPQLKWVVAISEGEDELFTPVRAQVTSLLIVLGFTATAVLLFALWYSTRLAAPPEPEEMDMHLVRHPRVHRIEEPDEAEEAADEHASAH